jgi:hypothetical protein
VKTEKNIPNGVAGRIPVRTIYCFGPSRAVTQFRVVAGCHHIDGDGCPLATGGPCLCQALPERNAFDDSTSNTVGLGCPRRPGQSMIPPQDRASTAGCDADTKCLHVPCFQVQLDASRPGQAFRQANACAYHVPDVIEALQAWAGEHDLADGQLTILAIEPAAGGRMPGQSGGPGQREQQGFAFSRIPLGSVEQRD